MQKASREGRHLGDCGISHSYPLIFVAVAIEASRCRMRNVFKSRNIMMNYKFIHLQLRFIGRHLTVGI